MHTIWLDKRKIELKNWKERSKITTVRRCNCKPDNPMIIR